MPPCRSCLDSEFSYSAEHYSLLILKTSGSWMPRPRRPDVALAQSFGLSSGWDVHSAYESGVHLWAFRQTHCCASRVVDNSCRKSPARRPRSHSIECWIPCSRRRAYVRYPSTACVCFLTLTVSTIIASSPPSKTSPCVSPACRLTAVALSVCSARASQLPCFETLDTLTSATNYSTASIINCSLTHVD